ncbi:MAG TPA: phage terminase large subunit [Azospirillaceae bacterium]|nr:phage terminase large subunit [Azospirillaceae bacterium]
MAEDRYAGGFLDFVADWNAGQGLGTPELHRTICGWLEESWHNGDRQLLLMAFRDSGKSTLVGLFCAWLLLRDPTLRLLVLAADLALAKKMVRNVKRIVERNPLTRALKPARLDQWAAQQFTVVREAELRDPSMLAQGITANITGSRADIVICDDVEVPNTCDTAQKREDLRQRLSEIDYVLVPGGTTLYIGTPHTEHSLYAPRSKVTEGFKRLELPLLDAEGASAWPERFPLDKVEALKARHGPTKFASQMMLQPIGLAAARLDHAKLGRYSGELAYHEAGGEAILTLDGVRIVNVRCWWDPAYARAERPAGDGSVIAAMFEDGLGRLYLHRMLWLVAPEGEPLPAHWQCVQAAAFLRALHIPGVTIECNGFGRTLHEILKPMLAAEGIRCEVLTEHSHVSKPTRILNAFDIVLAAGRLSAHDSVWESRFAEELKAWRPLGGGPDDGLDAVAGCIAMRPVPYPRTAPAPQPAEWRPGARPVVVPTVLSG